MRSRLWLCTVLATSLYFRGAAQAKTITHVKVMIVSMFAPEGAIWRSNRDLSRFNIIPGLRADDPAVHCGRDDVCQITTGMGYANTSASIAALIYSKRFDLRQTYWLVAGIAGIDPKRGTLGSAAWAHYIVDFGLQWELDARDAPKEWPSGYLGINTKNPGERPSLQYGTEVFKLDDRLLQHALALSRNVSLSDSSEAQKARAAYPSSPANQPPTVTQCDTLSSDTWFSGAHLSERASVWVAQLTDGHAVACTTQQEDNATYEVLRRGAAAGLVDVRRVAVLRSASDFNQAPPGGNDADNLINYQAEGGFMPALTNLYRVGNPLVQEIVHHWPAWRNGVPSLD
ncbi:MAG: purine-nucleoside phosphorylase [Janthinobacterium lividum]